MFVIMPASSSFLAALAPAPDTNEKFYRKYNLKRELMDASMDADTRIRAVLYTARVSTLKEISRLVREGNGKKSSRLDLSDSEVLKLLQQNDHAVCVRGVWVLASKFAVSIDEDLAHEAIAHRTSTTAIKSYEELCRDYILCMFQESKTCRVRRGVVVLTRSSHSNVTLKHRYVSST